MDKGYGGYGIMDQVKLATIAIISLTWGALCGQTISCSPRICDGSNFEPAEKAEKSLTL
jgi:hypothetical protein